MKLIEFYIYFLIVFTFVKYYNVFEHMLWHVVQAENGNK